MQVQTSGFQHTAARRRLAPSYIKIINIINVSTHSRPKAAGFAQFVVTWIVFVVSTHSRPKAAGERLETVAVAVAVSTHSRPKAAG